MIGRLGLPELIIILLIIILIFGANRLPDIGRGIGKGIKNFKEANRDGENDDESLENHARVPDPPGDALAIQPLQQRDRVLPGNTVALLEPGDIDFRRSPLPFQRLHFLLEPVQSRGVEEQRVHLHQQSSA